MLSFFAERPFLDPFVWPPTLLDELGAIAREAVDQPGASDHPGFQDACYVAGSRAFFAGDIDEYRRYTDLARASSAGEAAAGPSNMMATLMLFDGDVEQAIEFSTAAITRARRDPDVAQLAWMLAYLGVVGTLHDADLALPFADESLVIARGTGSTLVLLYPLVAVMSTLRTTDPSRALAAAEELMRLDRTRRLFFLNFGRNVAATMRIDRGEIGEGLSLWQEVLRVYQNHGERSVFSITLGGLAASLVHQYPNTAIEFAALAESDAITHFPAFTTDPVLGRLAESHAAEVAAARNRFEAFGYDDAVGFLADTCERLIAEHGPLHQE